VDHVKRYVVCQCGLNYRARPGRARIIETVTNQDYEATFGTNLRQPIKGANRGECRVEYGCVLIGQCREAKSLTSKRGVFAKRQNQRRPLSKANDSYLGFVAESPSQSQRRFALLGNDLSQTAGLVESKDKSNAIGAVLQS
jgi:hypothetical protein